MSATTACILAAIVILVVLVAVHCYRRRTRAARSSFMPGDPATPKIREAVSLVGGDLACISDLADAIEGRGRGIEAAYGAADMGPAFNKARQSLANARTGMGAIVASIKALRASLGRMPPTYQNALALYRGLRDSDPALRAAATALDAAGAHMQSQVSSTDDHDHTGQVHISALKQALAGCALQLRQMSVCFGGLARNIHVLGGALLLE